MASMDNDSFRVRVEKIFGSLAPSKSTSWSLTEEAIERREWRRDKDTSARDETPCSSSFDEFLRKDHRRTRNFRLHDDGDGDEERSRRDEWEWEIRSSIGLDPTLDNEEEEDEFDKVASGRENAGERLYMNDVTDRGPYMNLHNVVPNTLNRAAKDPRANHQAARIRLKEDEDETQNLSFHISDCDKEITGSHAKASDKNDPPNSILKRKNKSADSKLQKRVRFDASCKIDCVAESERVHCSSINTSSSGATVSAKGSQPSQNVCRVPDYLVNPSKYTHYSFDSSTEYNEESSIKAVMRLVKDSKAKEIGLGVENASGDLRKAVTFIPRKKTGDVKAENSSSEINENKEDDGKLSFSRMGFPVGVPAVESQHIEVSPEEDIEPEIDATYEGVCFQKPNRKYRTPSRSDNSD